MNKIHTMGYGDPASFGRLARLMADPATLLIDTRMSPRTGYVLWDGDTLKRTWGSRYHQAGRYLGNINYKGGPIELADPVTGLSGLVQYLNEKHNLILLCGCKNYWTCHRHVIIDLLRQRHPDVEVVPEPLQGVKYTLHRNNADFTDATVSTISELSTLINKHVPYPNDKETYHYFIHVYKDDEQIGYGAYSRAHTEIIVNSEAGAAKGLNDALYEYAWNNA